MEARNQNSIKKPETHADSAARENNLSDWLALHEVAAESIKHTLNCTRRMNQKTDTWQIDCQDLPYQSPTTAWILVASALRAKFPAVSSSIESAQGGVETDFDVNEHKSKLPFTLDRRPNSGPLVSLHYRGTSADLMCLAHEFSHALQIQLATQQFINPVLRELAAFIGELAFIDHLASTNSPHSDAINDVWQQENLTYFGADVNNLEAVLAIDETPYNYRWNYPVARLLAIKLCKCLSADQLWQVFLGNVPLKECITMASLSVSCKSEEFFFTAQPGSDMDYPALTVYRTLGMMSQLDLHSSHVQLESSIEQYYADHSQNILNQTVFVVTNSEELPIAYATWRVEQNNEITLTKQSAPFGDHITLQNKLRDVLPENTVVKTSHSSNDGKDQISW